MFSDPDGDEMDFSFIADDELNMIIDEENVLRFNADEDVNGEFEVILTADDGQNEGRVMGADGAGNGVQIQFDNQNGGFNPPERDDEAEASFMIIINFVNDAPVIIEEVADVEVDEDVGQTVLIADISELFFDVDLDDLVYSFEGEDVLNLALDNNRLTMNPEEHFNGISEVTITADDQQDGVAAVQLGLSIPAVRVKSGRRGVRSISNNSDNNPHRDESVDDVFSVTVNAINDDPFWVDPPEEFEVNEGEAMEFVLTADDFDFLFEGDENLNLSMIDDGGAGGNFVDNDDYTGTFTLETGYRDAGQYNVSFEVSDQVGATADLSVEINVINVQQVPEIVDPIDDDVYDVQVDEGDEIIIEFAGVDADNDLEELSWAIDPEDLPDDWTFVDVGAGTAEFLIDTNNDQAGDYEFTVTVTDPDENEDQILITITVGDVNRAPAFVQPTDQDEYDHAGDEGEEMRFRILAEDPDGDNIQYDFDELLDLLGDPAIVDNGDGSFNFVWTPPFDGVDRVYEALITVDDGNDEFDDLLIHITVADVNRSPIVEAPIADVVMQEDDGPLVVADLDDVFSDPDGDEIRFEVVGAPADVTIDIDNENVLTITLDANFNLPGGADITVRVIEVDFNLEEVDVFNLIVVPVNDAPGAFALTSPDSGSIIDRENWDWSIAFDWEASDEVDGDDLTYLFYAQLQFEVIDSTITIEDLDINAFTLSRLDTILIGMGIFNEEDLSIEVIWWVEANDGEIETESSERWTLTVPVPTAIGSKELPMPKDYSLSPVYPNPFNPSVNIIFSIPIISMVKLSVWNLEGRKISQMINQTVTAGEHNMRWFSHDEPSGVYIFLLQVNGQRFTTKCVLVK